MATYNQYLAQLVDAATNRVSNSKFATPYAFGDLTDINLTGAVAGNTIQWNGSQWVPPVAGSFDGAAYALPAYIDTAVSNVIATAGPNFDTLSELATAIDNDANLKAEMEQLEASGVTHFVGDGSTTTFTFSHYSGNVDVWINGIKLNPFVASSSDQSYSDTYSGGSNAWDFKSVQVTTPTIVADLSGANALTGYRVNHTQYVQGTNIGDPNESQLSFRFLDPNNTIYFAQPSNPAELPQATAFVSGNGGSSWFGPFIGGGPERHSQAVSGASGESEIRMKSGGYGGDGTTYTHNDTRGNSWGYHVSGFAWNQGGSPANIARIFSGVHNSYPATTSADVTTVGDAANSVSLAVAPGTGDILTIRSY